MNSNLRTAILSVGVALSAAATASAQAPATTLEALGKRMQIGDPISVTDQAGSEISGTLERLSADALVVRAKQLITIPAGDVRRVIAPEHDSIKNGLLIGLGFGGAMATVWCLGAIADDSGDINAKVECGEGFTVFPAVGALVGAGIDGVIPGKRRIVYEAPAVKVRPLLSARAKGVAVVFTF